MRVYININGDEPPFRAEIVLEGEPPEFVDPLLKGMEKKDAIIGHIAVELGPEQIEKFEAMPLVRVEYL